ncbi:MAG TPA: ABC transporter permease [Trueperaceae bacterium]
MNGVRRHLPVILVLLALVLLGYPLALLFGLPLALRDMNDLRKWEHATISARPLARLDDDLLLEFPDATEGGLLVRDDVPLDWEYAVTEDGVRLAEEPSTALVSWAGQLEPQGGGVFRLPESVDASDPTLAIYAGTVLLTGGTVKAREVPEGVRETFSFPDAQGPVIVDGDVLEEGEDYEDLGERVRLSGAPSFGSDVRRVRADYGVVDAEEGLIVLSEPTAAPLRVASSVVRLAEVLEKVDDPEGRRYRFASGRVVETDRDRRVFVGNELLSDTDERPEERVDGVRRTFTFESPLGIVTVDGRRQAEGEDYERDGNTITFTEAPPRNARLRQYPNYFLADPRRGEIELAIAPRTGETVWTSRYQVYARPSCGTTVIECFFALPQHPVPFPHWIVQNVGPFFSQYPLADERNVVRATLYTTLGTIAALLLGSAVGIVLAVLFVLLRPLEQALLPWVVASQTIPIIALVPVLLLILGNFGITIQTSLLPTAIIGAYIAFFPMVVGTVKGLRSVDPLALDLMRSYAATPLQVFAKVRFPAAVPFFFTSLKLATAAALVGALVAETESNNRRGLGFQILGQVQSGDVADVWILLIVSALLGVGLVALVSGLQRILAPWERS